MRAQWARTDGPPFLARFGKHDRCFQPRNDDFGPKIKNGRAIFNYGKPIIENRKENIENRLPIFDNGSAIIEDGNPIFDVRMPIFDEGKLIFDDRSESSDNLGNILGFCLTGAKIGARIETS